MPNVSYSVELFPHPYDHLNTLRIDHPCSGLDLFRFAVANKLQTASFSDRWSRSPTRAVFDSAVEPALFVYSNVTTSIGRLSVHQNFRVLTPTEKGPISRQLGEAFARFYAQKLLGVSKLFVLESIRAQNAAQVHFHNPNVGRPKQPDMIGNTPDGAWHVLEAKGVSLQGNLSAAMEKGKVQAANIKDINGVIPSTRIVAGTLISYDGFDTTLTDPPAERAPAFVEVDVRLANLAYYRPFVDLRREDLSPVVVEGVEYLFMTNQGGGAEFGIARRLLDDLKDDSFEAFPVGFDRFRERESDGYSLGTDGYAARLS
ncbi:MULTISPECIES: hypothetical protein [Cryobacterium]|uniref:Uncharacterized protein n=1 Tax=Cryobacterium breve TaxID=1259258 RepID=A0ABY2JAH2_9MICO|nr:MULTISPECIES: hypothetical protein [Cryobacterium]TFC91262.1 hypothetical protein E3T20_14685 [Cryobacterium sp. TmT3-12]TFD01044.1 hypothetical protein E3O65_01730 [Cryobacterium breve]